MGPTVLDNYLLGDEFYRQGQFARARARFETVVTHQSDFLASYALALCDVQSGAPETQAQRRDRLARANAQLGACLRLRLAGDGAVWVYLLRGYVLGQLGEFGAAETDFSQALDRLQRQRNPGALYILLNNRGTMRVGQGKEAGIDDLQSAITVSPNRFEAYLSLANTYERENDSARAGRLFNQALEVARELHKNKELAPAVLALLHRNRARFNRQQRRFDLATEDYQRAIDILRSSFSGGPGISNDPADREALAGSYFDLARCLQIQAAAVAIPSMRSRDWTAGTRQTRFQREALRLLRRALDLVPPRRRKRFWHEEVQSDPALAPLRSSDEYLQMDRIYRIGLDSRP